MSLPPIDTSGSSSDLRTIDLELAALVTRMCPDADPALGWAAALTSRTVGEGHTCLSLEAHAGRRYPDQHALEPTSEAPLEGMDGGVALPRLSKWREALLAPPAMAAVGQPGQRRPLVLDSSSRLYLHRYWCYEQRVGTALLDRARPGGSDAPSGDLNRRISALFPTPSAQGGDRQRLAAVQALRSRLTIITGGPGTGKTYTIARLLALLVESAAAGAPPRIQLAAPTGKAAMRMQESIRAAKRDLAADEGTRDAIPEEATTIHRLLGTIPGSPYFRHDRHNRLPVDVLIVDEASMIDLPLMAKLIEALEPDARLILLGDMDQLASVDPGAVLGDICRAVQPDCFSPSVGEDYRRSVGTGIEDSGLNWDGEPGLGDCIIPLSFSHRYPGESSLGRLNRAIREGRPDEAIAVLKSETGGDATIDWSANEEAHPTGRAETPGLAFRELILAGFKEFLNTDEPVESLAALARFRVLCAFRRGPSGVTNVNRLCETILSLRDSEANPKETGLKRALAPASGFYDHQPILITRNDYSLGLFNGDVGVVLAGRDPSGRERTSFVACFNGLGATGERTARQIPAALLPTHETAFALTIHKAQGSEFDRVLALLPPNDDVSLTRELLYTALTRARKHVVLWCPEQVLRAAIARRTVRHSGLEALLRAAPTSKK